MFECTYSVCVSRVFWWRDSEKCALTGVWQLSVLAVYLLEQQLPLYSLSRIIEDDTVIRTMISLQMNSSLSLSLSLALSLSLYIYIYIYSVSSLILNFNSDGHEAIYIITYDDVKEKSVSRSEVICLESCWVYLQPDVLRDLNIVIFTYVLSNSFWALSSSSNMEFFTMWSVYCLSLYVFNVVFIFKIEV